MKRLAAALLLFLLAFAAPAQAHKLKVFATVAGDSIAGYAFFIGGGRARGTPWIAKDSAGATLISGTTDAEGRFAFALPPEATGDVTVTVDTREDTSPPPRSLPPVWREAPHPPPPRRQQRIPLYRRSRTPARSKPPSRRPCSVRSSRCWSASRNSTQGCA